MPRTAPLRAIVLMSGLAGIAGIAGLAVAHATQAPRAPAFRVSTELIQLDVVVTDSSGKPFGSLTVEDFDIEQDGKAVPVRFAEFIQPGSAQAGSAPSAGSPAAFTGRRIVVVVADSFMNFDSVVRSKEALTSFVAESLRAGDLVAIAGANDPPDPIVRPIVFTADREELGRQIGRLRWDAITRRFLDDPLRAAPPPLRQSACAGQELGDDLQASSFKYGHSPLFPRCSHRCVPCQDGRPWCCSPMAFTRVRRIAARPGNASDGSRTPRIGAPR